MKYFWKNVKNTYLWFFISHGHSFGASLRCHTKNTGTRTCSFPVTIFEWNVRGHEQVRVHSPGLWMANGDHMGECAVWPWAGESRCALQGYSAPRARAQRCFSFGCAVCWFSYPTTCTPPPHTDLSLVHYGSFIIIIKDIILRMLYLHISPSF